MGKYDFDNVPDRHNTGSLKYDYGLKRMGRSDLMPMWVADMDFPLPKEILARIKDRTDHGIFGYTEPGDSYYRVLGQWFKERYGTDFLEEANTLTPGVVFAIAAAIRAFSEKGEKVLICEPVYYPFRETIEDNGRVVVSSNLSERNGHYEIDFEDFEKKASDPAVKLFVLCNPHNPVGRVYTREELTRIADICLKNDVIVMSDEIHCDFIYKGVTFTSFLSLDEKYTDNAIVCTSPGKTFNLAGLQLANIQIPNKRLRLAFRKEKAAAGYSQANTLGITATEAAYELGGEYLDELLAYLEGNLDYMSQFFAKEIPGLRLIRPEGTYLVWVDFSRVASTREEMRSIVLDGAKLWLDEGGIFGKGFELFERFNIACTREFLRTALESLRDAVSIHKKGGR
ncbi:MAG: pyridoxal phosphate-dependent aminotransferase [Lachnospiraceae bacterium]|nr:pyridoxal phosphate-dependent aminotransferase [Lachnospiraceae bacterium]